ncbi:hypothetical protein BKA62DRAFT_807286 [Auriculariales sp. MPI-PUGE-AT-0066]|nr:hypothetical protein BKA62DRAFT_807286 [Auriculariales sp. MPI-PUGE-AT-0066]
MAETWSAFTMSGARHAAASWLYQDPDAGWRRKAGYSTAHIDIPGPHHAGSASMPTSAQHRLLTAGPEERRTPVSLYNIPLSQIVSLSASSQLFNLSVSYLTVDFTEDDTRHMLAQILSALTSLRVIAMTNKTHSSPILENMRRWVISSSALQQCHTLLLRDQNYFLCSDDVKQSFPQLDSLTVLSLSDGHLVNRRDAVVASMSSLSRDPQHIMEPHHRTFNHLGRQQTPSLIHLIGSVSSAARYLRLNFPPDLPHPSNKSSAKSSVVLYLGTHSVGMKTLCLGPEIQPWLLESLEHMTSRPKRLVIEIRLWTTALVPWLKALVRALDLTKRRRGMRALGQVVLVFKDGPYTANYQNQVAKLVESTLRPICTSNRVSLRVLFDA